LDYHKWNISPCPRDLCVWKRKGSQLGEGNTSADEDEWEGTGMKSGTGQGVYIREKGGIQVTKDDMRRLPAMQFEKVEREWEG